PFDWLSNGSMISLHSAIDDATGNVTALRFERTECLDGYFRVLEETILSSKVVVLARFFWLFILGPPQRKGIIEQKAEKEGLRRVYDFILNSDSYIERIKHDIHCCLNNRGIYGLKKPWQ
ncbi:MAG: hypothetical protein PHX71_10430, partial [Synergistales bacterium]|nr:hypothetical protein [Synergistales bacterium]